MSAKKNRASSAKQAARQRTAEIRAQQEAAERKRRLLVAAVTSVVVLAIIGAIVAVAVLNKDKPSPSAAGAVALDAAALSSINDVPASAFAAAGVSDQITNGPKRVKDAPAATREGKPQVLYVGAEYCPYCAGLRWSTAVALGRFGQWTSLTESKSIQEADLDPLSTVSFSQQNHGAAYASETLTFNGYETTTSEQRNGQFVKLDRLEGQDDATFKKYDFPPYVEGQGGSIPFLSIGGKTFQSGGIFDVRVLEGKSTQQIATALKDPQDETTKQILSGANVITAAICEQTGNKPADVCSSAPVKAGAAKIKDHQ